MRTSVRDRRRLRTSTRTRALCAALVAVCTLGTVEGPARAQSAPSGDYAIPSGWFFTESSTDQAEGLGFAVQDGHAANLWTSFQAGGGAPSLGYPVSRRFEWDGQVAQAFSTRTVLRWNPATQHADVLGTDALPGRAPPAYANVPEQPPVARAELAEPAWSAWWWPASGAGGALFAPNGPLDKYDRYVAAATGTDPGTRAWERQHMYFPSAAWAGHCNGAAAAALLDPEPLQPVTALGITFSVADLKGLLVDYHFGDPARWSFGDANGLNPAEFQRMLLDWLGARETGFVLTFDLGGGEVWSYAAYAFESEWEPDAVQAGLWHVTTTVWLADTNVTPEFVGTRPYPSPTGMTFTYDVRGDPRHPEDGNWTSASHNGRSAHPDRIWFPDASSRNDQRELVSPGLDRATIDAIMSVGEGHLAVPAPMD